jgi:CelD/BcsL family acetyltransferase involved in cellulose biosynthesis
MGNRVARHGTTAVMATTERPLCWWLDELWRLHAARWSSLGQAGVLADTMVRGFHAEIMEEFAARCLLRLYALQIGADIAGIYYGFVHRQRAYGYLTGFDPAYAYYSPGTFVVSHAIEQAILEGLEEFHFLRGDEAYKYTWGAADRWNRRRTFRRQNEHALAAPT